MRIKDAIALARKNESSNITVILAQSNTMPVFITAWLHLGHGMTEIEISTDIPTPPLSQAWAAQKIDYDTLAMLAGQPIGVTKNIMDRLVGLHLIYPDGTANIFAEKYIQIMASRLITAKAHKAAA